MADNEKEVLHIGKKLNEIAESDTPVRAYREATVLGVLVVKFQSEKPCQSCKQRYISSNELLVFPFNHFRTSKLQWTC